MARTEATLDSILFAQDFLHQHWDWNNNEKAQLGNVEEMGKIIKSRLEKGGCEIAEMYGVKHDKDEKKIWNEYKMVYELQFTSNHAHYVIKFKKGKGKILKELADLIGIETNYIEKPKRGRYAYDNMLSYLTHIKYDKKFQYPVSSVVTLAGRNYIEYYRERREAWIRGRAERSIADAKQLYNFLRDGIIKGEITLNNLVENKEWQYVYVLHKDRFDKLLQSRKDVDALIKLAKERDLSL